MLRVRMFIGGLVAGTIAGVVIAVLTAPKSGTELRRSLIEDGSPFYRKLAYEVENMLERLRHIEHDAQVIEATDSLQVQPTSRKTKDTLNASSLTTAKSQQLLSETDEQYKRKA